MQKLFILCFSVSILLISSCNTMDKSSDKMRLELNKNWKFRQVGTENWMPAQIPGSVHTDLMNNDKIEDPFYRLNEKDVQWVDKKDWEYKTTFWLDEEYMKKDRLEILFEGLDTYTDVYLNGEQILTSDNMFREWLVDVKDKLIQGENELTVYFHSPTRIGLEKYDALDYIIPVSDNDQSENGGLGEKQVSVHVRKAGYHFGWDWGPRLVTSGIWKPIILRAWDEAIIRDLFVRQKNVTNETALFDALLEIESQTNINAKLVFTIDGKNAFSENIELKNGLNKFQFPLEISNPELWWPNGLGDQKLYEIEIKLSHNNQLLSQKSVRTGIRTVEVIQETDSIGKSFYFKVNGHPVFMKGANYIPQDVFLNRVSPDRYKHIIESAKNTNMNMIRIWGGGIYEKDIFYDLCDENGILVWQDFMFACAMFPGDKDFLDNVRHEAIDNVKRLRNHPSIALWCGNNENLSAWFGWGWKQKVKREQGEEVANTIWKAYDDLFHHLLPEVVEEYDSDRLYWSSSPSAEMGKPENWVAGDVHYWGVWWGKEPFTNYRTKIPRFMSEYGFQSFPELSSVNKYATENDWDIFSEVMKSHQRSNIGNGTIETYMDRHYRKPKDFPMFLYVGHLLQAEGIKVAMEGHRKHMPYCMGSLFWQIDDCWPVASWSSIDYYGKWKAQQYFAKKAFSEILVSPETDGKETKVFVVSDRLEDSPAKMEMTVMDFEGNVVWEKVKDIIIKANSGEVHLAIQNNELFNGKPPGSLLLYVKLSIENGDIITDNTMYFTALKELNLPQPELKSVIQRIKSGYKISLSSNKLVKNIYLTTPGIDGFFSDNYFDILPGQTVELSFETKDQTSNFEKVLNLVSLVDSY
ncbi:MAG: glycoside hydrolase family 2 protein [Bacteroidales bacterium]|nr:glycoside hydrolase family 2 protein [Bacteroidales bacterium]